MDLYLTPKRRIIALGTIIVGNSKMQWFNALAAEREAIEAEIGSTLQWIPDRGEKSAMIFLEANIDPRPEENRGAVLEWFREATPRWHKVFSRHAALLP